MCSAPVTFGGGITITWGFPPGRASGLKLPDSSQRRYQRSSTGAGAYLGGSDSAIPVIGAPCSHAAPARPTVTGILQELRQPELRIWLALEPLGRDDHHLERDGHAGPEDVAADGGEIAPGEQAVGVEERLPVLQREVAVQRHDLEPVLDHPPGIDAFGQAEVSELELVHRAYRGEQPAVDSQLRGRPQDAVVQLVARLENDQAVLLPVEPDPCSPQ